MVRFGLRWALVLAFLISAGGLLLLSGVSPNDSYAIGVLPGMLVVSFGSGLGFPALAIAGVSGTDEENAGLGSAILSSVQQIGGAVGLAVLVSVATRRSEELTDSVGPTRAATEGFSLTLTIAMRPARSRRRAHRRTSRQGQRRTAGIRRAGAFTESGVEK